jgi:hypothetical protein
MIMWLANVESLVGVGVHEPKRVHQVRVLRDQIVLRIQLPPLLDPLPFAVLERNLRANRTKKMRVCLWHPTFHKEEDGPSGCSKL